MTTILSHCTLKSYFTTSKCLIKFLKALHKTADIYLADLNYQFISEFELFLRKHTPTDHQKKLQNNGVMKQQNEINFLQNLLAMSREIFLFSRKYLIKFCDTISE